MNSKYRSITRDSGVDLPPKTVCRRRRNGYQGGFVLKCWLFAAPVGFALSSRFAMTFGCHKEIRTFGGAHSVGCLNGFTRFHLLERFKNLKCRWHGSRGNNKGAESRGCEPVLQFAQSLQAIIPVSIHGEWRHSPPLKSLIFRHLAICRTMVGDVNGSSEYGAQSW